MVRDATASGSSFFKHSRRPLTILAVVITFVVAGVTTYRFWQLQSHNSNESQKSHQTIPKIIKVVALGKLEPQGQVIKISAPTSSQESRVGQLLVKEGQEVKVNQVIAILDSKDRLQAAVVKAQQQVKVKHANLAKVQAGAKRGEIEAQKATVERLKAQWEGERIAQQEAIARLKAQSQGDKMAQQATVEKLQAQLNNAQAEYQRNQQLYSNGAISKSLFDSKRLSVDTATQQLKEARAILTRIDGTSSRQISEAQAVLTRINTTFPQQINEAKATLQKIAEVRPVDVEVAKAEVDDAIAQVNQTQKDLQQAYVRTPQDGQVLDIHTRAGEVVSSDGIVEIGQTSQMDAVAEIYQSDISKIRPGQDVRIISDSLPGELQGKVERIGLQVRRQSVINTDPSTNIDARIVEVHIRLDKTSSQKAAQFTNLQVKVVISL